MDPAEKKAQIALTQNPELCKITEEVFFWDPYCDHERNRFEEHLRPLVTDGIWNDVVT